jgi:glutamyl-Q tRNA(Asp) synthetase
VSPPVFRFAPSPNGYLHLGHARSALLNFDLAQKHGGRLLLRIEDIDATRCRPEFEDAIYEDLAWLGICWEQPVLRQSDNLAAYRAALDRLAADKLLYPSFETRREIVEFVAKKDESAPWPRDPDGAPLYPGFDRSLSEHERARRMAAGEPHALRLDMVEAIARAGSLTYHQDGRAVPAMPELWGDVVLARKETPTSYHLSVVVDDAAQGITDVVRGKDLAAATGIHRLLQALLGLPEPCYQHHALVLDDHGRKLSKSTNATSLRELRRRGVTPAAIRGMAALA